MKRLFFVFLLLTVSLLIKGQYHVSISQKAASSVQIYYPTLIDAENRYSPTEAYVKLNNTNPATPTPYFDTSKVTTGWYSLHLTREVKSDLTSLSAFVPKTYEFTLYSTIDSGRTFREIPKNINRATAARRSGDTLVMPPAKSKYFPPAFYHNYLAALQELERRSNLTLLVKIVFKGPPEIADIELRSFNYVKARAGTSPPVIHDLLKALLIIAAIFSLVALVLSREMVYLVFFCTVLYESYSFYLRDLVRDPGHPVIVGPSAYLLALLSTVLFYLLYANLLWKKWRSNPFVKAWAILGAIEVLVRISGFVRRGPGSFLRQNGQLIFICISIAGLFVIISALVNKIKKREETGLYTGLLFLLLLPILFWLYLGLHPKMTRSLSILFEWSHFTYLFVCMVVLSYRYWLIRKEAASSKMAHRLRQQRLVSEEVIHALEEERKRLAKDLHDDLGGNLGAIKMTLQATTLPADKEQILLQMVDRASANVRSISHNLMPPEFSTTPLHVLLRTFYEQLNSENGLRFEFIYKLDGSFTLSKEDELVIYRIIMELTHNIIRHAAATEATIQLLYNHHSVQIIVEDNGAGMRGGQASGTGLKNVQSRVAFLNGHFHLDSSGKGTTIIIQIPQHAHEQ